MTGDVKRPYRSVRRREQAEQTRTRVLDAAADVFRERGYERTTIAAVASRAGVADETVYTHFGNKRTLLGELVQRAVRGGDARPVPEQPGPRALAAATDQREQLRLFAGLHEHRSRNLRVLVEALRANGPLRLSPQRANDTVWALTSPELHQLLTVVGGWSRRRYTAWLASSLEALLLT